MNQILSTESKKAPKGRKVKKNARGPIEIKGIVRFFSIVIMLFGVVLIGEGTYAMYRQADDLKPENVPTVTIGRVNDQAIVQVEHNVEIMQINYSWNDGQETVLPINDYKAQEKITLLGEDSVLTITVEDAKGKKVTYKKKYLLSGEDITKPTIEIQAQDGSDKMTIIAKDETAMAYMAYEWDGEEIIVDAEEENQKEITREVSLTPGTKTIKVTAEDMNGNVEKIEKEIVTSTAKPKITVIRNDNEIFIQAQDKDGVKDITVNLNGAKSSAKDINQKDVTVGPLKLREGNNTISVEVTNVSGYTETATGELEYNP